MKKLFSLVLVVCMVMTACAAFAESSSGGLSSLFGGLMGGSQGSGEGGGLSSLFGGLMGGGESGQGGGLADLFSGLMGGGENGQGGGLADLFGGLMGGSQGSGEGGGLADLFGGLMGGSEGGEGGGLADLFGSLMGGAQESELPVGDSTTEAAPAEDDTAPAAEEAQLTPEAEAGLEALANVISEASPATYIAAESAEQFYGTWRMTGIIVNGYKFDMEALTEGEEDPAYMVLRLSEEVFDLFEAGEEPAPKTITSSELVDGALKINFFEDGQPETANFMLTDDGELHIVQSAEEGGDEAKPTYIVFVPVK